MDTLLQWINEPGPVRWVVDILLLPLIVVLLIFAIRALLLRFTLRGEKLRGYQRVRRQTTKSLAILLSLVAVILIWRMRFTDLSGRTEQSLQRREVLLDWLGGTVNAVIATIILLFFLMVLRQTFKWAVARLDAWREARNGVQLQGMVLITPLRVRQFAVLGMRVVRFVLTIALFYFYVPVVLSFIPVTRPLAGHVMPLVIGPARDVGLSFLAYLPRFVSMILIIVGVRYFLKFLVFIMAAVAKEEITIPGFDAEWADQTARLLKIGVTLGTLMLIYPFLPGAGSEVFKGFSLFVGAMFTLGASSSVSNMISGIILTYTRSFRIGDRIHVGGTTGDVLTRGLFVTRLRTVYNEQVTVPNNVALGGRVVNYSAAVATGGLALSVTAGIGYNVDWRQVHELMKSAAQATEDILEEPEPVVLQTELADFAVSYELRAWTDAPSRMVHTRSALRQNVLDRFNEAGVEIMTPNQNAVRNSVEPAIPESYVSDSTPTALRFLGLQGGSP
jgi:small-conductance mechanosensitive channel